MSLGDQFRGASRIPWPSWTAWVRRLAPNYIETRLEWVFTVFSLTKSFSAISRC